MAKRTLQQNKIIHQCRTKTGITDENYRLLVFNLTNGRTESSKDLTQDEADQLIKALDGTPPPRGKGVSRRTQQRRNKAAGVVLLVTPAQREALTVAATARWGTSAASSLSKLCQRMFRRKFPHTSKQASALINAINSMSEREPAHTQEAA